tara:strand:- start:278 stop:454 length:177 start_codon:yes stop_codon:yes gene_type:complete
LALLVVSRDNNLYVVGDISRKCLDTTETNNYQVCELVRDRYELREQAGFNNKGHTGNS